MLRTLYDRPVSELTNSDVAWLGDAGALRFPPQDDPWGRKGWAAYFPSDTQEATAGVYVRMGLVANADWDSLQSTLRTPLVLHELLVQTGAGGATEATERVRGLPLSRMEAAANLRLARLPERPEKGDYPFVNWDVATRVPPVLPSWEWTRRPERPARMRRPSLKLKAPAGGRKPDSFYEQVAEVFLYLSSQGRRPAEELAEANGVPVTTAHRWVKEARRREILYAGKRGKGYV